MQFIEWFIAWRYLFSRDRRVLVSVNTIISVMGVAVGVAVLVVVMGVMDGAMALLFGRITDLFPHVQIARLDERGEMVSVDPALAEQMRQDERVEFAEPVLNRFTLIQPRAGVATEKEMVHVVGAREVGPGTLFEFSKGAEGVSGEIPEGMILVGKPMAEQLGLTTPGAEVVIIPFNPEAGLNRMQLRPFRLKTLPSFETGYYEYDYSMAFVSRAQFHQMFPGSETGADYIHVRLKDAQKAREFARGLDLPAEHVLRTWEDTDADFFASLKVQKYTLVIILMLIVVVAAFNIIGTLVLMVYEKTREVGILKATGMRAGMIARVFLLDGVLIGLSGTVVGVALGLLFSEGLRRYRFEMPAAVYNFESLPVRNEPMAIVTVVIGSMLICTLASLLPAIRAARLNPVDALRYE